MHGHTHTHTEQEEEEKKNQTSSEILHCIFQGFFLFLCHSSSATFGLHGNQGICHTKLRDILSFLHSLLHPVLPLCRHLLFEMLKTSSPAYEQPPSSLNSQRGNLLQLACFLHHRYKSSKSSTYQEDGNFTSLKGDYPSTQYCSVFLS